MSAPASPSANLAVEAPLSAEARESVSPEASTSWAVVPFGRGRAKQSKAAIFCEKYLADVQGESIEERSAAMAARHKAAETLILEASDASKVRAGDVEDARRELESGREQVANAMEEELQAARDFNASRSRQAEGLQRMEAQRYLLLEAQKKLAMIQVMQENHVAIERLKLERSAALKAVQDFKRSIVEHRALERKALEAATRKAAPSKVDARSKRKACEAAQQGSAEEAVQAEVEVEAPSAKEAKRQHAADEEQEPGKELLVEEDALRAAGA